MKTPSVPTGTLIFAGEGLTVRQTHTNFGLRLIFEFDRPEAKGVIVLEECSYGLFVICPAVHPELPVALLDLFYASPEGRKGHAGPPLQIEFLSPLETDDPLGQVRYYPNGTRVHLEPEVVKVRAGRKLTEIEFGCK